MNVSLQTKSGNQRKVLKPGDAPEVSFAISEGDEVEAVYAYCNLHGLWKRNIRILYVISKEENSGVRDFISPCFLLDENIYNIQKVCYKILGIAIPVYRIDDV